MNHDAVVGDGRRKEEKMVGGTHAQIVWKLMKLWPSHDFFPNSHHHLQRVFSELHTFSESDLIGRLPTKLGNLPESGTY